MMSEDIIKINQERYKRWRELIELEKVHMFKIVADYRPNNPHKPTYYLWGKNKAHAKRELLRLLGSFFKIYDVDRLTKEEALRRENNIELRPFNSPLNFELTIKR